MGSNNIARIQLIKSWIHTCNQSHGGHCISTPATGAHIVGPVWLIDVRARCLRRATPSDRYLSLSYVWGSPQDDAELFQTTKQSITHFQQEGAFAEDNSVIPQTILDAIEMTRQLSQHFLWVDRFCIVQDDKEEKAEQIRNMTQIYANAYLTIIAAGGDANNRLSKDPRPDKNRQVQSHQALLDSANWNTRAWTLQEMQFSRRAIFFFEDTLTWECHCDLWEEHYQSPSHTSINKLEQCLIRFSEFSSGHQRTTWPDMEQYALLVARFSTRKVSKGTDTLPAFSGILTFLSGSFPGGFVYGLPAMFFDVALLWRPTKILRRKSDHPSWSWLGWDFGDTEIDLTLWRATLDYVLESQRWRRGQYLPRFKSPYSSTVTPKLCWTLVGHVSSITIENAGFRFRYFNQHFAPPGDESTELPPGWKMTQYAFQHESDTRTYFTYPIPLQLENPAPSHINERYLECGRILSFETARAWFKIEFYCYKSPFYGSNQDIAIGNIYAADGAWVGHFRSHDGRLGLSKYNFDGSEKLEFIFISEGKERDGSHLFDKRFFNKHVNRKGWLEFVNVLWIEWKGRTAERRGLGHIVKKVWEMQPKEMLQVLLE